MIKVGPKMSRLHGFLNHIKIIEYTNLQSLYSFLVFYFYVYMNADEIQKLSASSDIMIIGICGQGVITRHS